MGGEGMMKSFVEAMIRDDDSHDEIEAQTDGCVQMARNNGSHQRGTIRSGCIMTMTRILPTHARQARDCRSRRPRCRDRIIQRQERFMRGIPHRTAR